MFESRGHRKAKRLYGWHHRRGQNDQDERFVAFLELAPVESAQAAVKIVAAKEIKDAKGKK